MSTYCGTDIIEVDRIRQSILRTPGFKKKVFTPAEIDYAESKGELVKFEHYAGRFAAKEAVYKAMSNIDNEIEFRQIEILNDKTNKNRPMVKIRKTKISDMILDEKLAIDISISHIKEYATAVAYVRINKKDLKK